MFMPAMTLGGRITYVLKNGDKAVRTWDLNTVMELNKDHTDNLKMDLTRIIPGQKISSSAMKKRRNLFLTVSQVVCS